MKRPTAASRKKVTVENLAALGAERLAEILVGVAATRPELKRRLRMELAAEQGAEHLLPEIDKRLASLETSRSKVTWRQRPAFVRDVEALRVLIAERLAGLDAAGATERLWSLLGVARRLDLRLRDKDGELAAVFDRAAADLGGRLAGQEPAAVADRLVEAMAADPARWARWLPKLLDGAPEGVAAAALARMSARAGATAGWVPLLRRLAEAAGDLDAWRATFGEPALKTPAIAAVVARRFLAAGRTREAGEILHAAAPAPRGVLSRRAEDPDPDWEEARIEWLDAAGRADEAQAARWAAFERTLSADHARAFARRLPEFEDVEAENRAFAFAAAHPDATRGLAFLMAWPAIPEAAALIQARADELKLDPESAELWAARLRARQPKAAHALLRRAAAAAFRRRDFATCDRLTQEADAIAV